MISCSTSSRSAGRKAAAECSCFLCAVFPLLHVAHERGTFL